MVEHQPIQKVIAVSGGFDQLHGGHLRLFQEASKYGNVVVILNSDDWLIRKKGTYFLPYEERAAIINALECVNMVVAAEDDDGTVAKTLEWLKPHYFANGGDRNIQNTPEKEICDRLGIEMLYNIGGEKTNSSSLVAKRGWVERKWGRYKVLAEGVGYKIKELVIKPKGFISMQRHDLRNEHWIITDGYAEVLGNFDGCGKLFRFGDTIHVKEGKWHQLVNASHTDPLHIIEFQSGSYLGEDDIIRLEEATA